MLYFSLNPIESVYLKRNFTMLFSVWIQLNLFIWKNEWGDSATYGRLMHLTAPHFYRFSILMRENDVYLILPRFTSFYLDFSFSVLSVLDLSVYTTIIIYILNWSFCTTNIFVFAKWQIFKLDHLDILSAGHSVNFWIGQLGTRPPWHSVALALDHVMNMRYLFLCIL